MKKCWYKRRGKAHPGIFQCWSQWADGEAAGGMAVVVDARTGEGIELAPECVSFAALPPWPTEGEVRKVYMCLAPGTGELVPSFSPIGEVLGTAILIEGLDNV